MARRPIDYAALRNAIPMIELLRRLGWQYTTHIGQVYRGPCPIHGPGRTGSRSLSVEGGVWYCHKCKLGGDALELWMRMNPDHILEAAYRLCEFTGIEPPVLARR